MNTLWDTFSIASSGMQAQSTRLLHVSENIANQDTPGYQRKFVTFQDVLREGMPTGEVQTSDVQLDTAEREQIFDPSHPMSDETGHYVGTNVNLIIEMADAREAHRSYEANLRIFDQARQMSKNLLELLRH